MNATSKKAGDSTVRLRIYDYDGNEKSVVPFTGASLFDAVWLAVKEGYATAGYGEAFHVVEDEGQPRDMHWIGYAWHKTDSKYKWRDSVNNEEALREMVMTRLGPKASEGSV